MKINQVTQLLSVQLSVPSATKGPVKTVPQAEPVARTPAKTSWGRSFPVSIGAPDGGFPKCCDMV